MLCFDKSECRSNGTFEVILDEFFVFSGGVNLLQLFHTRILFVSLGGYEDVNKRVIGAFNQQTVLRRIQLGNQCIVGIDYGNIKVATALGIEAASNSWIL